MPRSAALQIASLRLGAVRSDKKTDCADQMDVVTEKERSLMGAGAISVRSGKMLDHEQAYAKDFLLLFRCGVRRRFRRLDSPRAKQYQYLYRYGHHQCS